MSHSLRQFFLWGRAFWYPPPPPLSVNSGWTESETIPLRAAYYQEYACTGWTEGAMGLWCVAGSIRRTENTCGSEEEGRWLECRWMDQDRVSAPCYHFSFFGFHLLWRRECTHKHWPLNHSGEAVHAWACRVNVGSRSRPRRIVANLVSTILVTLASESLPCMQCVVSSTLGF